MRTDYEEYRISSSQLTSKFLKEQLCRPNASPYHDVPITIMDETTVTHFEVFVVWLREGKVCTDFENSSPSTSTSSRSSLASSLRHSVSLLKKPKQDHEVTPEQARKNYELLLGCYALATLLYNKDFQDALASKLVSLLRSGNGHQSQFIRLFSCEGIEYIITQHGFGSPLFLLVASAFARFASAKQIATLAFSTWPGEFKNSVLAEMAVLRATQHMDGAPAADFASRECEFHMHNIYHPCSVRRA
jgi:hypothetical protein